MSNDPASMNLLYTIAYYIGNAYELLVLVVVQL
jgi:hypothetical protein